MNVYVNGRLINGGEAEEVNGLNLESRVDEFSSRVGKVILPLGVTTGMTAYTSRVMAQTQEVTGLSTGFDPLIEMVQEFAFPIGVGMASWGLIEMMLGNPNGKEKVRWSLICYVGIFVIPYTFEQIRVALSSIG